jgi:hypothetical protein
VYAQNQFGASNQWVQLAVAIAAALGVLAVPNTPAAPAPVGSLSIPGLGTVKGPISAEYEMALRAALAGITPTPPGSAPGPEIIPVAPHTVT